MSPATIGTHIARTEWSSTHSTVGMGQPLCQPLLYSAPPYHTAHGTEGRRWEGQTKCGRVLGSAPWHGMAVGVNIPVPGDPQPLLVPPARHVGCWAQPLALSTSWPELHTALGLVQCGEHWDTPFGMQTPIISLL